MTVRCCARRRLLPVACALLALGCAACQGVDDQTATVGGGAAMGTAVGAGIGALLSGGSRQGTLAGAALGAVLGTIAGVFVDQNKRAYATAEDTIEGETALVASQVDELRARNTDQRIDLARLKSEITALEQQRATGVKVEPQLRASAEAAGAAHRAAVDDLTAVESELVTTRSLLAGMEHGADTANWEREIAELERERDVLKSIAEGFRAAAPSL